MPTITDNLAAALRAVLDAPSPCHCGPQGCGLERCGEDMRHAATQAALEALADHDAAKERAPEAIDALRAIVADVDKPGHTIRNISAASIANARAVIAAHTGD